MYLNVFARFHPTAGIIPRLKTKSHENDINPSVNIRLNPSAGRRAESFKSMCWQKRRGRRLKRWRKANIEKKNTGGVYHRRRRRRGSTLRLGCRDLHSPWCPRRSPRRTWCYLCHKYRSGRVLVSIHPCRCTTGRLMCSWQTHLGKQTSKQTGMSLAYMRWKKRTKSDLKVFKFSFNMQIHF